MWFVCSGHLQKGLPPCTLHFAHGLDTSDFLLWELRFELLKAQSVHGVPVGHHMAPLFSQVLQGLDKNGLIALHCHSGHFKTPTFSNILQHSPSVSSWKIQIIYSHVGSRWPREEQDPETTTCDNDHVQALRKQLSCQLLMRGGCPNAHSIVLEFHRPCRCQKSHLTNSLHVAVL